MPRAPNPAKRQQAAGNQRDTRHENGIVNPAKRVTKQKSQGQLDNAGKPAVDNASTPPVPSVPPSSFNASSAQYSDDMPPPDRRTADGSRLSSLQDGHSSTDSLAGLYSPQAPEEKHRQINVNDAKNSNVHRDLGPLDFAITVLRSCPLHDTIAILIILMQVSPVALATIYMLFTLLTFVPPVTTSSGISITEIFDGIQGTPSLWTLVGMDVIMLLIWLFLFAPAQQFILDLAQVVIALTLGGGASSRTGAANNIFICVAIVGLSQWTRSSQWPGLYRLGSLFGSNRLFVSDPDDALESTSRAFEKKGAYGWIRSILAIHILTQGLVRWIREWYLRREKKDLQSLVQMDPEVGKPASFPNDGLVDGATPTVSAPPEAHTSHGSVVVSTKKRRKQSAQVRIRQPLWAALASTKIVMVKEYELSHAASESAGSNATDIHNLGNAPFNTQPEQIWICYIGSDEVCFNTSHFRDDEYEPSESTPAGVDASKPFYVRVNNAVWQPTRITPIEDGGEDGRQGTCWTGDIYGLTPLSTYDCQFFSTRTGEVIFSTSVRTIQTRARDLEAPSRVLNNPRPRSRHDSPASTLRASIAAAEVKLADEKARLKATRKDNKTKINAAKREIEKLTSAVQSAGGNDEKLRQKIAQNTSQQKQAELSIEKLQDELKDLETVPEDLLNQYRTKQSAWTAEKAQFDGARATFKSFKTSIDRELKALEEEQASLQSKRNKIASRIAKVDNEHARITDANARGLDEAERRRQVRAVLEADMARNEQQLLDKINTVRAMNVAKQAELSEMAQYMSAYLETFHGHEHVEQTVTPQQAPPTTHSLQATATQQYDPWASASSQFNHHSLWPPTSMPAQTSVLGPTLASPFMNRSQPTIGTPPHLKTRGRSSSMLSDVSGFTQSEDEEDRTINAGVGAPPGFARGLASLQGTPMSFHGPSGYPFGRHQRSDLGSGSGSGSGFGSGSPLGSGRSSVRSGSGSGGSVRDPISPV